MEAAVGAEIITTKIRVEVVAVGEVVATTNSKVGIINKAEVVADGEEIITREATITIMAAATITTMVVVDIVATTTMVVSKKNLVANVKAKETLVSSSTSARSITINASRRETPQRRLVRE